MLRGMGELHLEVTIDRMRTELGVEAAMGKPKVSFREAFGGTVEHIYTHKKQTGGSGQFAEVKISFEPAETGTGIEFIDEIVGGRIPREFIPSVEHAINTESKSGQIAGYEVVDFKARLLDGKFHEVDSSALAFEIAGRACFREAHKLSRPKLLEPIMRIEVVIESTYLGDVIGDINRRRGQVTEQGQKGPSAFVQGFVPMAEMFGYISFLRSATSGRGDVHDGIRSLLGSTAGHGRRDPHQERSFLIGASTSTHAADTRHPLPSGHDRDRTCGRPSG